MTVLTDGYREIKPNRVRLRVGGYCAHGHLLTEETLRIQRATAKNPARRKCKICVRIQQRVYTKRGQQKLLDQFQVGRECPKGHVLTEDTLLVWPETESSRERRACAVCRYLTSVWDPDPWVVMRMQQRRTPAQLERLNAVRFRVTCHICGAGDAPMVVERASKKRILPIWRAHRNCHARRFEP